MQASVSHCHESEKPLHADEGRLADEGRQIWTARHNTERKGHALQCS